MMLVEYDPEVGATYLTLTDGVCASTVHVDDLVMVDVDRDGQPIGVEFAISPRKVTSDMLRLVAKRFPTLEGVMADPSWLYATR